MDKPPDGTGTVFVRQLSPGVFTAIWQGDGQYAGSYVDIQGARREVLDWVEGCRAAIFLAFDPRRNDYVAFEVQEGRITNLPI